MIARTTSMAFLAAVLAAIAACGGEERLAPVDGGQGGGGTTSTATTGAATTSSGAGAGTPVREVLVRNPMGDQVGNLLADGDFELSITSNPGQHGWSFFGSQGTAPIVAETGGTCRSGLRCAVFPANGVLFARGTAAPERQPMTAEVWVRPLDEAASCGDLTAYAISCDAFTIVAAPSLGMPHEEDGWCAHRWSVPGVSTAVCLYLENGGAGRLLVDHASLRARDDAGEGEAKRAVPVVRAATRARMDAVRDHLRRTLPLGPPAHDPSDDGP